MDSNLDNIVRNVVFLLAKILKVSSLLVKKFVYIHYIRHNFEFKFYVISLIGFCFKMTPLLPKNY